MSRLTLRQAAAKRGLLIGSCCEPGLLDEPAYVETLGREFNALVAENCMKFHCLQPERGVFNFAPADRLVRFAKEHGMRLRGHALVWHYPFAQPRWFKDVPFSKTEALDILRDHIIGAASHFRGSVICWDVVNEAIDDKGAWREDSPWFKLTGRDYLEAAFRWAHEADPDAKLFYNDYNIEMPNAKADTVYALLKDMLKRGVPLHGVGFQYHLRLENKLDMPAVAANIRRFADLGLEIHLTEMDVAIKVPVTDELRREQAAEYEKVLRPALEIPAVKALLFWGLTDRHSWIPGFTKGAYDESLPFDRDYRPKPAYEAIMRALA